MKKSMILMALVMFPGNVVYAEANCSANMISRFILDTGVRANESGAGAVQLSCSATHKSGFYGGVWLSQSTTSPGRSSVFSNSLSYFVGRGGSVGDVNFDVNLELKEETGG
jgi:hypothetical protein